MNVENVFACLWLSVTLTCRAVATPLFAGNTSALGASFSMPISAVNPSVAIIAKTLRMGDYLLERLRG